MRRRPEEFESESEVIERLELAGLSKDRARRAVRDMLPDRRYLKRVVWVDRATGAFISDQLVRVAPRLDEINRDSGGTRHAKIEILIADVKWYLDRTELLADVGAVGATPSNVRGPAEKLAGESAAIKALASHLKDHRDITRVAAREWLVKQGFAVSGRGFQQRVWPEARDLAGMEAIAPRGAKRKSSRIPQRLSKSAALRTR
jgi:hypothetical protein